MPIVKLYPPNRYIPLELIPTDDESWNHYWDRIISHSLPLTTCRMCFRTTIDIGIFCSKCNDIYTEIGYTPYKTLIEEVFSSKGKLPPCQ